MPTKGLKICTPTVTYTGPSSTATIDINGQVTFANCNVLTLSNIFTSSYENYLILANLTGNTGGGATIDFRLRTSSNSTDSTTNYTYQRLNATGSTTSTSLVTGIPYLWTDNIGQNYHTIYIFGPYLAQETLARTEVVTRYSSAYFNDIVWSNQNDISYDSCNLVSVGPIFSGTISIYGWAI